jgi:acyl-CoA synthetase (AMP-forming)/AMP-acid ligase II
MCVSSSSSPWLTQPAMRSVSTRQRLTRGPDSPRGPNQGGPDEAKLIEFCRERVGSVKKVTSVEFVAELPRSPLGKVLRRQVRERFWTGQDQIQGA